MAIDPMKVGTVYLHVFHDDIYDHIKEETDFNETKPKGDVGYVNLATGLSIFTSPSPILYPQSYLLHRR
jgi:hypothetical protein